MRRCPDTVGGAQLYRASLSIGLFSFGQISRDTRKVLLFLYPLESMPLREHPTFQCFPLHRYCKLTMGVETELTWADIKRHRTPLDLWVTIDGKGKREEKKQKKRENLLIGLFSLRCD